MAKEAKVVVLGKKQKFIRYGPHTPGGTKLVENTKMMQTSSNSSLEQSDLPQSVA